ncbi:hypothetical protein SAMN05192529_10711 [Arachidicoccus rhizosphaerae]|uniref:Uncharacterized protein n=2 Tax=Arachidicoccus rhizosphaerae TaxID=551991 RepID=A0A1H3Y110_9BACT|nr:hypothetical protein SAMN05192529_10711 [Arachidicoccus rhizosphaerae]
MKQLTDVMPIELQEVFQSACYDDLAVCAMKFPGSDIYFDFLITLEDGEQTETQVWQLQVKNCPDCKIDMDNIGGDFYFYSDHYLISAVLGPNIELYFKKPAANPEALVADIYKIHKYVLEDHIVLEKYINGDNLLNICTSAFGLFAKGPKTILKYYFECLEKANMSPYYYDNNFQKDQDAEKKGPEAIDFKLAVLGGIYFVGEKFTFIRLDKKEPKRRWRWLWF